MYRWCERDKAWWVIKSIFPHSYDISGMSIVGFTLNVANNDFADFSVNSQPIFMHYSKRYFLVMGRLLWKFHWKVLYPLKVSQFRGFVKLKIFKKSEKNSEAGGWVKPQFFFFPWKCCLFFVVFFCCCTCFQKNVFFQLDKTP